MKRKSVDLRKIRIEDPFWSKHVRLVRDVIIPYQWEIMNDRVPGAESSHCLENFKIAAGVSDGEFYGAVFQDTDVAKWLEAVGFSLAACRDEKLEKTADEVIDLIAAAQGDDGYINTYFTIKEPGKRFTDLCEGHELYTAGHLMEAACAYYWGTGKRKFLDCMLRFADLICDSFGSEEGKNHGYPGHQEVEIGLIKLAEVTGEKKYLKTAKFFIDARGEGENYFLQEMARPDFLHIFPEFANYQPVYSQSHLPVREQLTAEGHAVRAVYMYCAMADLADAFEDGELLSACRRLWDNMVNRRMFVTGSIGSSGILERFTTDYDLPNDYNYSESCASIGLALFGLRMANITKEASYIDVVERALYNTVLAGIALDGRSFFYVNPLEVWPDTCIDRTSKEHVKPIRQKWFGVACCPPNIARTLASLGQYIYSTSEEICCLNLFISNEAEIDMNGEARRIKVDTAYPFGSDVRVCVSEGLREQKLGIRIPEFAKDFRITRDGETISFDVDRGYAVIEIPAKGSEITVSFLAPARYVSANPLVRQDAGKVCMMKGPLVYTLEEADNGNRLTSILVDTKVPLVEKWEPDLLGGATAIYTEAKKISMKNWNEDRLYQDADVLLEDIRLKAVPYCYWNNRGIGEMCVWLRQRV